MSNLTLAQGALIGTVWENRIAQGSVQLCDTYWRKFHVQWAAMLRSNPNLSVNVQTAHSLRCISDCIRFTSRPMVGNLTIDLRLTFLFESFETAFALAYVHAQRKELSFSCIRLAFQYTTVFCSTMIGRNRLHVINIGQGNNVTSTAMVCPEV